MYGIDYILSWLGPHEVGTSSERAIIPNLKFEVTSVALTLRTENQ